MTVEFKPFPKIGRLTRSIIITEKIDGTNAGIQIVDGELYAQSRNRMITPDDDNYGFARWVHEHRDELRDLGEGAHYGEWWGQGIQRRYGLTEKRFSLFNTGRWTNNTPPPACCHVVPVLYGGMMDEAAINGTLTSLLTQGSVAAPGFMNPEGIVIYHTATKQFFKKTALGVDGAKGEA